MDDKMAFLVLDATPDSGIENSLDAWIMEP
jgi:hypothetical protein